MQIVERRALALVRKTYIYEMINRQSPAKLCCLQINRQLAFLVALRIRSRCTSIYHRLTLPYCAIISSIYIRLIDFFFTISPFRLGCIADGIDSASLSGNVSPVSQPVSVYTCASKCGPSISLCIQKRDFGIASRPVIPFIPSLASLRPIEGDKKENGRFHLCPPNSSACPGDTSSSRLIVLVTP